MMFRTVFIFLSLIYGFPLSGQQREYPEILHFEALEKRLNQDHDTTYIVHFWATWCLPCLEEMTHFQHLEKETFSFPVKILLVSLDFVPQIQFKLMPYLERQAIKSEVVVLTYTNPNDWIDKVSRDWSGALPATLVRHLNTGSFREGVFENYAELQQFVMAGR